MKGFLYHIVFLLLPTVLMAQDDISAIGTLPEEVWETSGLIFHGGKMITHNDSGNTPQLFEIDTTSLQIVRTVTITNATNTDWEAITQDDDFIYIGDIGNNSGDRQDLNILKIAKSEYDTSNVVTAERIDYIYEDQNDFSTIENSDWDAEALFVLDDNLVILTKQWRGLGTVAYRLPKLSGAFLAERLDSYQVNGLITDATYNEVDNTLNLIGYSSFLVPFFAQVEDVEEEAIFSGTKTKSTLDIGLAQVEALTKVGNTFYASSEEFSNASPPVSSSSRLFRFLLNEATEEEPEGEEEDPNPGPPEINGDLVLYRSFNSKILNYRLRSNAPIFGMGVFDSIGRLILFTPLEDISGNSVDLSVLPPSMYHLAFFYGDEIISKPFFLN
jgi:hypothetical protein